MLAQMIAVVDSICDQIYGVITVANALSAIVYDEKPGRNTEMYTSIKSKRKERRREKGVQVRSAPFMMWMVMIRIRLAMHTLLRALAD